MTGGNRSGGGTTWSSARNESGIGVSRKVDDLWGVGSVVGESHYSGAHAGRERQERDGDRATGIDSDGRGASRA